MSSVCKRATRDTFHHHSRRTFTHFKGFLLCLHRSGNMWKSLVCPLFFFLDNCSRFGESIKNCEQLDIGFVFPRRWKPLPRQSKHKNFTIETKEHSVSLRNEKRTTENRALHVSIFLVLLRLLPTRETKGIIIIWVNEVFYVLFRGIERASCHTISPINSLPPMLTVCHIDVSKYTRQGELITVRNALFACRLRPSK